jgi:branched-chain amino acid transport system substrate-binding protein
MNPATAITKTHELVEKDKVNVLAGGVHSGAVLGIRDYIVSHKVPMVVVTAGANVLTQEKKSPYIFRVGTANAQQHVAGGWYAHEKLGFKSAFGVNLDFVTGHEYFDAFEKVFTAYGGQIVGEAWPAIGTADYGPFLAQIAAKAKEIDVVQTGVPGTDAVRFVTQYAEYGLKEKIPLFVMGDTVDETILPAEGDAAVGIMFYGAYAPAVDTPANHRFVEAHLKEYGYRPSIFGEAGYVAARVIVEAIKAVEGDLSDTSRFLEALRSVQFDAPRGPFKFDKDQNNVRPIYIGKVVKVDGELGKVITDVIPDVDQYWTGPK